MSSDGTLKVGGVDFMEMAKAQAQWVERMNALEEEVEKMKKRIEILEKGGTSYHE